MYLDELQAVAFHHNLARLGISDGQIAVVTAHLVATYGLYKREHLAGEQVGEAYAEARFFLSVEVETQYVVVGCGRPDSVYDACSFHFGYHEFAAFLAQVGVFARESVVVAPCAVVAGELFYVASAAIFGQSVDGTQQCKLVCPSVFVLCDDIGCAEQQAHKCQSVENVTGFHFS